jgi:1-acyl-sn-glycerol-3-phosphate acyltransferase
VRSLADVNPLSLNTFLATLLRRSISIPVYLCLAAVVLAGLPLWCTLAALCDVLRGEIKNAKLPLLRATLFFALYFCAEVIGIASAALVWAFSFGGILMGRARYQGVNAALQRWFTGAIFHGSIRIFSMTVETVGQEQATRGPYVLFLRHTSTADTVLAAALLANPNSVVLRYVVKRELLWDPCLDLVGSRLRNAFVGRDGSDTEGAIECVKALANDLDAASGILIYPEGTRFSPEKLAARKAQSPASEVMQKFTHVLPPRLGGALALLSCCREKQLDLVILDHCGFDGAASFASFFGGGLVGKTLKARVRRIPFAQIPSSEQQSEWLFQTWLETNAWVAANSGTP